jgi:hypothetical protein
VIALDIINEIPNFYFFICFLFAKTTKNPIKGLNTMLIKNNRSTPGLPFLP